MLNTTIATKDEENNLTYTTTDKLYALYGNPTAGSNGYCTAGTNQKGLNNGLRIDSPYWEENSEFWLRTPSGVDWNSLVADRRNSIRGDEVNRTHSVNPAFQLNLSSVLFASSAKAAVSSGSITTSETFTLRYKEDSNDSIGSVKVDALTNTINVENAKDGAYLVVQNSSGAWAKSVKGTESFNATDVNASLTSLEGCKVWLEYTYDRIATAIEPITIEKAPTPAIETKQTASTITVTELADQDKYGEAQYKLTDAGGSQTIAGWQTTNIFEGLSANTAYTIYAKYSGNDTCLESAEGTQAVTTSAIYSLTIQAGNGGKIIQGTGGSYEEGANIALEAQPDTGYTFTGWTASDGGAFTDDKALATTFTMPGSPTTIIANFKLADVAPSITGEMSMKVVCGYEATSSKAFIVSGIPAPSVQIDNSYGGRITWNETTKKLEIAEGLGVGTYPVTLTANNGVDPEALLIFTLTIEDDTPPPHTHSFGDAWQSDSNDHWQLCTAGDGAIGNKAAHDFGGWITDKEPTEIEAGSHHRDCSTCGYRQTESIPPTGPAYTNQTLTDPSGVRVSGMFTSDAELEVKEMLLHLQGDCEVCDDIRARQEKGELIVLFDIALKSGKYTGELKVEIPVGEQYNGQTVILIHCKDKVLDSRTVTVSGGIAKGTFSSLSPFAAAKVSGSTAITGLPESYTLLVGQSVSWTPAPAGGSWSYDKALLAMTQDGDTYTFKALKEGKATATYTVDGVPHTVTITINSDRIPQTGDVGNPWAWALLATAALLGCAALVLGRKGGYKKRHG